MSGSQRLLIERRDDGVVIATLNRPEAKNAVSFEMWRGFAALLDESLGGRDFMEGQVVHGKVVAIEKDFAIVDAAMNDLMRPALYDAWHEITPVIGKPGTAHRYEIVGPVCESGDFLGHDRELAIEEGDLLAIQSAGAYGMSMSSNYNTRTRAAEVMVDGDRARLIRRRETIAELFAHEVLLP